MSSHQDICHGGSGHRVSKLVTQVFARHPIYDNILAQTDATTLARLACVNNFLKHMVADYTCRAFNINRQLSQFFNNPRAFRSLQARTAAIISGSFAVQFFDRTLYTDSDLDIYAHPNRHILDLGLFLMTEGYRYRPMSWQQEQFEDEVERVCSYLGEEPEDSGELEQLYGMPSLRAVHTFEREDRASVKKIQVVMSRNSPIASVLDFHSTCVMNIITYNAAYSLYPYATFERREALVINDMNPQAPAALVKYAERGWRIVANPSPLVQFLSQRAFHMETTRWVCDKKSWVIKLDMDGVVPPAQPSLSSVPLNWDPAAECSWTLVERGSEAQVYYENLHTTVLKWQYTSGCYAFWRVLVKFFRDQGTLEHKKIPPWKGRDDVPDAWTWWDHILPEFRETFQEGHPAWQRLAWSDVTY